MLAPLLPSARGTSSLRHCPRKYMTTGLAGQPTSSRTSNMCRKHNTAQKVARQGRPQPPCSRDNLSVSLATSSVLPSQKNEKHLESNSTQNCTGGWTTRARCHNFAQNTDFMRNVRSLMDRRNPRATPICSSALCKSRSQLAGETPFASNSTPKMDTRSTRRNP